MKLLEGIDKKDFSNLCWSFELHMNYAVQMAALNYLFFSQKAHGNQ